MNNLIIINRTFVFSLIIKLQQKEGKRNTGRNLIKQLDQIAPVTSIPPIIHTVSIVILVAVMRCMQLECF